MSRVPNGNMGRRVKEETRNMVYKPLGKTEMQFDKHLILESPEDQ